MKFPTPNYAGLATAPGFIVVIADFHYVRAFPMLRDDDSDLNKMYLENAERILLQSVAASTMSAHLAAASLGYNVWWVTAIGQQKAQEEMKLSAGDSKKSPSNVVHVFWDQVEVFKKHAPAEAEVHLTSIEQVGLTSGVQAGMEMHLWSYHQVVNAPSGVVLRRAADVLPLEVAQKCVERDKYDLRNVADLVRLLAVQSCPGKTRSLICGHMLCECEQQDLEGSPVQRLIFCFRV